MIYKINNNQSMEAIVMERQINQPSFLDSLTADLGGRRTAEFFQKCDKLIPDSNRSFYPASIGCSRRSSFFANFLSL
jgi:hypothetical protein